VPSSAIKAPDPTPVVDPPAPTDPVPTDPAATDPTPVDQVPTDPAPGVDPDPADADGNAPVVLPPGVQLPGPEGWEDAPRILGVDENGAVIVLVGHGLADGALF